MQEGTSTQLYAGARAPVKRSCLISFVVTTRNDDHGGRMLERSRTFMDSLIDSANKYGMNGELIIVDWNPPPGRPTIREALSPRVSSQRFSVRYIEVPPEAHDRFRNADAIPLFQMIAKNVGIERAKGGFIIATNPDLLFSRELIQFLARSTLEPHRLYRIDRTDVPGQIPHNLSCDQQLAWCARRILRIHRQGWSQVVDKRLEIQPQVDWSDFLVNTVPRKIGRVLEHLFRLGPNPLHTNACGDFTMMAREHWLKLRGYPEFPIWSMHIDSLMCYMAIGLGLVQRVLRPPMRLYHMEHGKSWVALSPENRLRTFVRRPWLDSALVEELHRHMTKTKQPLVMNDENWGLGGMNLKEHEILAGAENEPVTLEA